MYRGRVLSLSLSYIFYEEVFFMVIEDDGIYRFTELTKEGREINIARIGDVFLYRDSLEDKIYKIITE